MAIKNRNVGITIDEDVMFVTVGPETHKMSVSELHDAMDGKQDDVKYLVHNIGVSLAMDGVSKSNPSAIKAHVEGKTFKL